MLVLCCVLCTLGFKLADNVLFSPKKTFNVINKHKQNEDKKY